MAESIVLGAVDVVQKIASAIQSVTNVIHIFNEARSVILEIDNNTDTTLMKIAADHYHGGWAVTPDSRLLPKEAQIFGAQSKPWSVATGTSGYITYAGDGMQIRVYWDNPFIGNNDCSLQLSGPNAYKYFVNTECGAGNKEARMRYELFPAPINSARYGDTVRLLHINTTNETTKLLHSHLFNYGHPDSSGQQQVTCFEGADDNDLWRIKGPDSSPDDFKAGEPIQHGDIIRVEHVLTRRNLHSHADFPSPVTHQQEVTCFGENGVGDGNDNWRVEVEDGGICEPGKWVRLIHVVTNVALHSHAGYSDRNWTQGQQEVTGYSDRDDNDWWRMYRLG